jgi:hypothetical protein
MVSPSFLALSVVKGNAALKAEMRTATNFAQKESPLVTAGQSLKPRGFHPQKFEKNS